MSDTNPIDTLLAIADERSIDVTQQFDLSVELIGKKKAWKNLMQNEAIELLEKLDEEGFGTQETTEVASMQVEKPARTVLNKDTGEVIEVTDDVLKEFHKNEEGILLGSLKMAWHISQIMDKGLFVAANFESFEEYAISRLPFSYEHATKWAKIGRTFGPVLADINLTGDGNKQLASMQDENVRKISSMPFTKLYEMTKIEDADYTQLIEKGVVTLNGNEFSLQEILDLNTKGWVEKIKDIKEEYSAEMKSLEGKLDKVSREKEKLEKEAQEGLEYKKKYEDTDRSHDLYEQRIRYADQKARELNKALHTIEGIPPDFDLLCKELEDLFGLIQRGLSHIQAKNPGVVTARRLRNEKDKDLEE